MITARRWTEQAWYEVRDVLDTPAGWGLMAIVCSFAVLAWAIS